MCGIFGYIKTKDDGISDKKLIRELIILSESRGKESSGIASKTPIGMGVLKTAEPGSALIKKPTYKNLVDSKLKTPFTIMGHTRLVTNGALEDNLNNQPVIRDGMITIHNGIVVNDHKIWAKFPEMKKNSNVDTEVLLALIDKFSKETPIGKAIPLAFKEIEGTASVAILFNNRPDLLLATNNGSLYMAIKDDSLIFASEEFILETLLKKHGLKGHKITRVQPNEGYLINIKNLNMKKISLVSETSTDDSKHEPLEITDYSTYERSNNGLPPSVLEEVVLPASFPKFDPSPIAAIKRCSKCILTETMPFISFDEKGICNYCHNYRRTNLRREEEIKDIIRSSVNKNSRFDCIVPLSGGRDSSFALHYIKEVLGLDPIAYSYDWGMLTDLGRRNQARMCGKLGVEHIIVSADIRKKRENIRKNVVAWLKKPDPGIIPLFMAGDKQYFSFANRLSRNIGGVPIVYAENPLEKTDFKSGFCGVPPVFNIEHVYNLGLFNKFRLGRYYLKEYVKNPTLFNSSLLDTADAFIASYFTPHDYISLYLYKRWDEQEINSVLREKYDWELAKDTKTSWRIGDGTAAFYNLIYYSVAGFTEADTFRSNQIREGYLTREKALGMIKEENMPRYESIKWYCDIIGIDFITTLERIMQIPKLYQK